MVASRFFYHQNFQYSNYVTINKTVLFKLWSFSWRDSTDSWYWFWNLLLHQFGNTWIRWTKGIWKSKWLLHLLNFFYYISRCFRILLGTLIRIIEIRIISENSEKYIGLFPHFLSNDRLKHTLRSSKKDKIIPFMFIYKHLDL